MATNLYEVLGLDRSASPEEIRKAYKRRALKTHPDKVPLNLTVEQKAAAAEEFRKIGNAYEVLNDEEKRKVYDRYGVYPPPAQPEPQRRPSTRGDRFFSSDPFSDPFFSRGPSMFTFTDPFVLFNSLFGDIHRTFFDMDDSDPFMSDPFFSDPFSPFGRMGMGRSMFGGSLLAPHPSLMLGGPGSMFAQLADAEPSGSRRMYSSATEAIGRSGQWVSQSTMSRTINGRTEVITKRRDAEVNIEFCVFEPQTRQQSITAPPPQPASSYIPPPNSYHALPPQIQAQYQTPPQVQYQAPPPQPQYQTRPPPQRHQVTPSPEPQFNAQSQLYSASTSTAPVPPRFSSSANTNSHAYRTLPPPHIEPIPVQHQRSANSAMNGSAPSYRRTSSHGHSSIHSGHSHHGEYSTPYPLNYYW
ncbi:hypothetical protein IEO21_01332 [Rhodonia placenta]|uniref:J domain-containing protein n=1 Tax=Rhodonia placenta TaxID=104341 RepID=A0A8H7PA24_9APHY|nr:hypothetical protein IEO21_01332 [Postia placenta]